MRIFNLVLHNTWSTNMAASLGVKTHLRSAALDDSPSTFAATMYDYIRNSSVFSKAIATTSCKIVETLSLKNTFSSFQCPPYLEFKPFPLPLPSPPFNVDCLSSQHFFVLLATLIRGGGGLQFER